VTQQNLIDGEPRLMDLVKKYQPGGVLILGAATRKAAEGPLQGAGVPWAWVYHPTGRNNRLGRPCTPEKMHHACREVSESIERRA
jgi:hypothetical protein